MWISFINLRETLTLVYHAQQLPFALCCIGKNCWDYKLIFHQNFWVWPLSFPTVLIKHPVSDFVLIKRANDNDVLLLLMVADLIVCWFNLIWINVQALNLFNHLSMWIHIALYCQFSTGLVCQALIFRITKLYPALGVKSHKPIIVGTPLVQTLTELYPYSHSVGLDTLCTGSTRSLCNYYVLIALPDLLPVSNKCTTLPRLYPPVIDI